MTQIHKKFCPSHPFVDAAWQTTSLEDGIYTSTPDGAWDLIYIEKPDGKRMIFFTGQYTEPVEVPYQKGEKSFVIAFTASAYLAKRPSGFNPLPIIGSFFLYEGYRFPLPTPYNIGSLTDALIQKGLLRKDEIVEGELSGRPLAASKRSVQTHFRQATGIAKKDFTQIRRAQDAVQQLKEGKKPTDVAIAVGYTDQAHMIKSIKKIMGHLPSDVGDIHKL